MRIDYANEIRYKTKEFPFHRGAPCLSMPASPMQLRRAYLFAKGAWQ